MQFICVFLCFLALSKLNTNINFFFVNSSQSKLSFFLPRSPFINKVLSSLLEYYYRTLRLCNGVGTRSVPGPVRPVTGHGTQLMNSPQTQNLFTRCHLVSNSHPTRSPMSSWSRGLGQFADKRLPDGGGMRHGLSFTTTESHCWRPLGSGEEEGQLDAARPDSRT